MGSVVVSNCTFQAAAGLIFNVPPYVEANSSTPNAFNGDIEDCIFEDISTAAISFADNDWVVKNCEISNSFAGILYLGVIEGSTLVVDDTNIQTAGIAITYTAPGMLQLSGDSLLEAATGVFISQANEFKIGSDDDDVVTFTGGNSSINVDCIACSMGIDFDRISCNNTGPISFTVADGSDATISHITVTNPVGRALNIQGGHWGIQSVSVAGSTHIDSNGGAFHFSSMTGNGTFDLEDCTVTGASAVNGGAVFVSSASLNIDGCNFENNQATGRGGAIYAEKLVNGSFSITGAQSTFSGNFAGSTGGAIDLESLDTSSSVLNVCIDTVDFTSNNATTGAAVSCCNENNCNVTLVYTPDGDVTLEDNFNSDTNGSDVTCTVVTGSCQAAASDPDEYLSPVTIDTEPVDWLKWLVLGLAAFLVVALIAVGGIGVYVHRKRTKTYDYME